MKKATTRVPLITTKVPIVASERYTMRSHLGLDFGIASGLAAASEDAVRLHDRIITDL